MDQGHNPRSERISDRPSRRNNHPQPGYPAEHLQALRAEHPAGALPQEYLMPAPPFLPWPMNYRPPMMLLSLMWTMFVQTPRIEEAYRRCTLLFHHWIRQFVLPCRHDTQWSYENLFRNLMRCFEITYQQLLINHPIEGPRRPANVLTGLGVIHITQEEFLTLPGWQQVYIRQIFTSSSAPPPPSPPPTPNPSSPVPQRQFPPLPQYSYPFPPPPPTSTPPSSDTRTSTPEGPLDLSASAILFEDYLKIAPNLLTSDRPPFKHRQHCWTVIQESNDETPADGLLAQRSSPACSLSPPLNSPTNSLSDCFTVPAPEHFSEQSPAGSHEFQASCSSADSRPARLSEFTTSFEYMSSQISESPTGHYQPTTTRSLECYPSRSLEHSGGSSVGVSNARKREPSNECAGVGTLEPPPKRNDQLSLRKSVISFESAPVRTVEPYTVTENVPNPMHYFDSPSVSRNEPSTSRSFRTSVLSTIQSHTAIKNEASDRCYYERSSLRSNNVPNPMHYFNSPSVSGNEPSTPRSFKTSATSTIQSHTAFKSEATPVQLFESHIANVFNTPVTLSNERSSLGSDNVPNPMHFFDSPSVSGNDPSTSRSFKTSATTTIQSHTAITNEAPESALRSLRSFKLLDRGSNEPPPVHTPAPAPDQMTRPILTYSSMSPQAHSPMPTQPPMPPPTPILPPPAKPPKKRRPPSTIIPPTSTSPQILPPPPRTFTPVTHYSAYSPMFMPMRPSMHMARLPPNYMPLPNPENIPLPHQRREPASCPLCGVSTHSADNCLREGRTAASSKAVPQELRSHRLRDRN